MFDPWTATREEVDARQRERGKNFDRSEPSPARQWVAALNVKETRPAVEAGRGFAVMFAINECLRAGLIAPPWLAEAFGKRFKAVENLEVISWDDEKAFGPPFSGVHIDAAKEAREAALPVFDAVEELRAGGMPTGDALWEAAAEELGRDASEAGWVRNVYYATKKAFAAINARLGVIPKPSRGRPKKSTT